MAAATGRILGDGRREGGAFTAQVARRPTMKTRILTLIALAVLAIPMALAAETAAKKEKNAELEAKLETAERKAWDAFKAKDSAAFSPIWELGYTGVDAGGVMNLEQTLTMMKDYDIKDYTLSDFRLIAVDADVVLLMYKVTVNGTYKGQPMPAGAIVATSVYKLHDKNWLGVFHQETQLQGS
jgi:Ni/Co efflux regulator RcnB